MGNFGKQSCIYIFGHFVRHALRGLRNVIGYRFRMERSVWIPHQPQPSKFAPAVDDSTGILTGCEWQVSR